jgi:hypothetical protein
VVPNLWLSDEEPFLKRVQGCEIHRKAENVSRTKLLKRNNWAKAKTPVKFVPSKNKEETESFFFIGFHHPPCPECLPSKMIIHHLTRTVPTHDCHLQRRIRIPNQPDHLDEEEAERLEELATTFRTQLILKA